MTVGKLPHEVEIDVGRRKPGRVRQKLAEKLVALLATDGIQVRVSPNDFIVSEGFYRTDWRSDSYRWEVFFDKAVPSGEGIAWVKQSGGSYSRMSDCLNGMSYCRDKHGFWDFSALKEPPIGERHRRLRHAPGPSST